MWMTFREEDNMLITAEQEIRDPLLLAYIDRGQRLKRSPHTMKQHRQTARRYQRWLDELGLGAERVESWQVQEFFEEMTDLAPGTVRSHLRRLRSAYRYAVKRGVLDRDPTFDVELPRVPDEEPRIIETHELRAMKREIQGDQAWAQFHLLAFTGLRRCEAIRLQWEDLDFKTQTLTVTRGKGGKLRKVPIHPQLAEALRSLSGERVGPVIRPKRAARWIGTDTWTEILRSYTETYTAHDFRRTLASSLAVNGVNDALIDRILGWAPRTVGRRYYIKIAGPELQRAILRAYADDPI
jgi:integrase/recombinase XerC